MPLDSREWQLATLAAPIDATERAIAQRMRVAGAAWAAAHGALRSILGGYLGSAPESLQLVRTSSGKPRLTGAGAPEFSLSHADGLALVAVAFDRAVGVDVERENDRTDFALVAREFLCASDAMAIELAAPERRRCAFFAAWTRHEARLKLRGQGLGTAPAESAAAAVRRSRPAPAGTPGAPRVRRASFKEKHELAGLPARIAGLEGAKQALFARLSSPEFYSQRGPEVAQAQAELARTDRELELAYARWVELEELIGSEGGDR